MNTLRVSSAMAALVLSAVAVAQDAEHQGPSFESVDADQNGFITPAEAQDNELLVGQVAELFAERDSNSDGQLSADEYGQQEASH